MGTVLKRLMEAAGDKSYKGDYLTLASVDGSFNINQFKDVKLPWMLGFVKVGSNPNELEVSTVKYVNKVGSTRTRKLNNTVSVYTLLKCLKLDIEDNRFLSAKATEELLLFADHIVETNKDSKVKYKLVQADIDEYHHRNPNNDLMTCVDDDALSPTLCSLIPLLNHLEVTHGFRWVYRQLSGTEVEGLTKVQKLTFVDHLFIGALQAKNDLHGRVVTANHVGGLVNVRYINNNLINSMELRYHPNCIVVEIDYVGKSGSTVFKDTTRGGSVTLTNWEVVYSKLMGVLEHLPPLVRQQATITVDDLLHLAGLTLPNF